MRSSERLLARQSDRGVLHPDLAGILHQDGQSIITSRACRLSSDPTSKSRLLDHLVKDKDHRAPVGGIEVSRSSAINV
jgi:hypothetical protein